MNYNGNQILDIISYKWIHIWQGCFTQREDEVLLGVLGVYCFKHPQNLLHSKDVVVYCPGG